MAKLFGKLRALAYNSERKPQSSITKQKWNEKVYMIRGQDEGVSAWHYILVSSDKIVDFKKQKAGELIDYKQFGRIIQYRDNRGRICAASDWGINPPRSLQTWINENYENAAVDEYTNGEYQSDDIRLCIMQRMTSDQLLGICRHYYKQCAFHYITLWDKSQTSLAYRAGIRDYDRWISFNGINIEQDTYEQQTERFNKQTHLPVEMLVCSSATYEHYKSNHMSIHVDLPTVQRLRPVFDLSSMDSATSDMNEKFCVVAQCKNHDIVRVVSQSVVFKSSEFTQINDICFAELEEQYRKVRILFKGSQDECEIFETQLNIQLPNDIVNAYPPDPESNKDNCPMFTSKSSQNSILSNCTRLEDLPNELLLDLFGYLKLEDLHHSFSGLNARFNTLLFSSHNLFYVLDGTNDLSVIKFYSSQITRLVIDTFDQYDLNLFLNLHSLTICDRSSNHLQQIRPETMMHLVSLSFVLEFDFKPPVQLVNDVFSNRFPRLRYVNLGWIDKLSSSNSWTICPSLQYISIHCKELNIIEDVLASCPNLHHLQMHILSHYKSLDVRSSSSDHPLKRLTLWSNGAELTFETVDALLSYVPNVHRLYLQTVCRVPIIELMNRFIDRLHYLSKFDCFIKELVTIDHRIGDLNTIHQSYECFNRIQCIKENDSFRIFATK